MAQDAPLSQKDLVDRALKIAAEKTTPEMRLEEKEEILEAAMMSLLDNAVMVPYFGRVGRLAAGRSDKSDRPYLMHHEPRLPKMPDKPTLLDYFKYRIMVRDGGANHLLQSANLARQKGLPEKIVLACLLHDISVYIYLRSDHGYHGAQLIGPYVDEEVSFAVRYHQALRFYPDESVGYEYPELYIKAFGANYEPQPYIQRDYAYARNHRWYMSARLVTTNDLYAFDPNVVVDIDEFTDIVGRNFKQPVEGLGFDQSPTSHMWRSIIWPNNYL